MPGQDLAALSCEAIRRVGFEPLTGDVVVFAQKAVSKVEGRTVRLADVRPSALATRWALAHGKDPRFIEVVLAEAKRIVRMDRDVLICETAHGFVCANAGVDASNVPGEYVTLLPVDPDASAERLCAGLSETFGVQIGAIIADTFGRPWREGLVNVALGVAGLASFIDYRGQRDAHGRPLAITVIATADEIASAAELVMGKTAQVPVAIVRLRGEFYPLSSTRGSGRDLVRPSERDLFR
jgi:coenzyme F420-0:L-glutamate ligase/coenzyme F420-1:gamma-L-glutamate ligase